MNNLSIQKNRFKIKSRREEKAHVGKPVRSWEITSVCKEFTSNDVFVDIGCGVGKFTSEVIATLSPKMFIGVDVSEDQLRVAHNRFLKDKDLRLGDFHNLPLDNNIADVALLRFAIHHSYDPKKCISEIKRILKPNGKLLIIEVENFENEEANQFFNKLNKIREPSDFCFYSKEQLISILQQEFNNIVHTNKSYHINLDDWLNSYEEPEKTIPMVLNSNVFDIDENRNIKLCNQFIVAT